MLLLAPPLLGGCVAATVAGAAVSVGATAVSVGASAAGLAADAAIGTARLTGKAVGAAVDAASGGSDNSGVNVRFREPTAADRDKRRLAEQQAEEEDRRAAEAARGTSSAPPPSPHSSAPSAPRLPQEGLAHRPAGPAASPLWLP